MKLTVILSPSSKTGTSVVGNYIATGLAKKTGSLTLYIEFSKVTGRSIFFHGRASGTRKSLSEVVYDPTLLSKQIVKSKYTEFLHFICMNLYEDFLHMTTYVPSVMAAIITEASRYYDYIILDLPSNLEEPILGTVLSRNFEHRVDNYICVLDEDVLTAKLLYDLEALLKMGKESKPKELTYVVNKVSEYYIDYLERSLNIGLLTPVNLVQLPFVNGMNDSINRAEAYALGGGTSVKKFMAGIDTIIGIIVKNKRGIGLEASTRIESDKKIASGDGKDVTEKKGFFGRKPKTPKPKKSEAVKGGRFGKSSGTDEVYPGADDVVEEGLFVEENLYTVENFMDQPTGMPDNIEVGGDTYVFADDLDIFAEVDLPAEENVSTVDYADNLPGYSGEPEDMDELDAFDDLGGDDERDREGGGVYV